MTEKPLHEQHRRAERLRPGPLPVNIISAAAQGTVVDLSECGAQLALTTSCSVGTLLTMDLIAESDVVRLEGRVVWSRPLYDTDRVIWIDPSTYCVGIEFVDLRDQGVMSLQDILRRARGTRVHPNITTGPLRRSQHE